MRDNVRAASRRLIGRQRKGQLRIHQRKAAAAQIAAHAALLPRLIVGNDRRIAHLTARGGNGQDTSHRNRRLRRCLLRVEIPHVSVVAQAVANGLAGIDHAAAAHRQQEIHTLGAAKGEALLHLGKPGIRHHAAQLDIADARFLQRGLDRVQQAAALDAAAAVMQQCFRAAELFHHLARAALRIPSEQHLRGRKVAEIIHVPSSLLFSKSVYTSVRRWRSSGICLRTASTSEKSSSTS